MAKAVGIDLGTTNSVVAVLEAGPAAPLGSFVTIPEGYTMAQTVARIADPDEIALVSSVASAAATVAASLPLGRVVVGTQCAVALGVTRGWTGMASLEH